MARRDIYVEVTTSILEALEAGVPPWRCPWDRTVGLPLRVTGEAYRGINVVLLWQAAIAKGYGSPHWMTYRQAAALGGQVRKGEKSVRVIKYGTVEKQDETAEGAAPPRFGYLRSYAVFNAAQIDGLAPAYDAAPERRAYDTKADAAFMAWVGRTGLTLRTRDAGRAYYDIAADTIVMPPVARFEDGAAHAGTLLHEACHATGAAHRLNRTFGKRFGDADYIEEELRAELGAAMAGARLGIATRLEQNAAYLHSWITLLRSDSRAILRAASAAQQAADWLMAQAGDMDATREPAA